MNQSKAPSAVSSIAKISDGKKVRIFDSAGKEYFLSPGDPSEAQEERAELDSQLRATLAMISSLTQKMDETSARMNETLASLQAAADGQAALAETIKQLTATMEMDIEPVYDKAGKLIRGRRVPKLKG